MAVGKNMMNDAAMALDRARRIVKRRKSSTCKSQFLFHVVLLHLMMLSEYHLSSIGSKEELVIQTITVIL